jgi:hypothetical protein
MLRNESGMASHNQACARATHAALSRVCPIAHLCYFRRAPGVSASPPARDFWKSGRSTAPDPCAFANSFGDPRSRTLHSHLSFLLFPCCDSEFPIESFSTYSSTTMSDTKIRAPPSHYPFLAFHLVRTCSLVCSIIVSGILLYFCYWLKHDNYKIPWTFLVVCQIPSQPVYA